MLHVKWTTRAFLDLQRLHEFLRPVSPHAADAAMRALSEAPKKLSVNPRLGYQLSEFLPREVRRLVVERYEMRYELRDDTVYVLRSWHAREHRSL